MPSTERYSILLRSTVWQNRPAISKTRMNIRRQAPRSSLFPPYSILGHQKLSLFSCRRAVIQIFHTVSLSRVYQEHIGPLAWQVYISAFIISSSVTPAISWMPLLSGHPRPGHHGPPQPRGYMNVLGKSAIESLLMSTMCYKRRGRLLKQCFLLNFCSWE